MRPSDSPPARRRPEPETGGQRGGRRGTTSPMLPLSSPRRSNLPSFLLAALGVVALGCGSPGGGGTGGPEAAEGGTSGGAGRGGGAGRSTHEAGGGGPGGGP